jgi:hypothetical protein
MAIKKRIGEYVHKVWRRYQLDIAAEDACTLLDSLGFSPWRSYTTISWCATRGEMGRTCCSDAIMHATILNKCFPIIPG